MSSLVSLLRSSVIRRGSFTLASGKTSDIYVDVRQATLERNCLRALTKRVINALSPEVNAVGGESLGVLPIIGALINSYESLDGFIIRKSPKTHGLGNTIEGTANWFPGTPVCVLEDLTTTGASLVRAIRTCQTSGLRVIQAITVVDRQEGAYERVQVETGIELLSLFDLQELL